MKRTLANCILMLVVLITAIPSSLAQITFTTAGSGIQSSNATTIVLYKSNGADCEATVTFTNAGGPAQWKIYPTITFGALPAGVMTDGGVDIASNLVADPNVGQAYIHPGPLTSTFSVTLKSINVITSGFAIRANDANDIEVALNSVNESCTGTPLVITVTLSPNPNNCVAVGDSYPKYDITVSDNVTNQGPKTYNLSLAGAPPSFALLNMQAQIPAGNVRTVTIPGGLGGQAVPPGVVNFSFTLTATDAAAPNPSGSTAATPITIDANCKKNALVVKVDATGNTTPWAAGEPMTPVNDGKTWLNRVSYTNALFNAIPRVGNSNNPVLLPNPFSFYNSASETPINKLVQEVITKLVADNANELANIEHLLLFLNTTTASDVGPSGYWAVKKMTYQVGAVKKDLSVSINPRNADWKQVAHCLGHQFGLVDLSIFDPNDNGNIVSPFTTPIGFDIMAIPNNVSGKADINLLRNIHPLGESKHVLAKGVWVKSTNVEFVSNAANITSITKIIKPIGSSGSASDKIAIALGLDGGANLATEKHYIWIEARPFTANDDEVGAGNTYDGVVCYYSTRDITDGVGRATWTTLEPPGTISFSYAVGNSGEKKIGNLGWSIKSLSKNAGNYSVELSYTKPVNTYNTFIRDGATYSYLSPDIETVIPGCVGCPMTNSEVPGLIAGDVDTRVNGTVYNTGTTPAIVSVIFSISRTSVSNVGNLSKTQFGSSTITIPAKSGAVNGKVTVFSTLNLKFIEGTNWGADLLNALNNKTSHYCLYVDIVPVTPGDNPNTDNGAQKNSGFREISQSSPYPPIDYSFYVSNPDNKPRTVFFETKNVPGNWDFVLNPSFVILAPNEEKLVNMHIGVPPAFPPCNDFPIQINASMLNDHTLVPLSGIMPYIQLRKKETITLGAKASGCTPDSLMIKYGNNNRVPSLPSTPGGNMPYNKNNYGALMEYYLRQFLKGDRKDQLRRCATIYTNGCTNPAQPNALITLMYQDPAGNPIFKQVMTDAAGCYTDEHVVVEGGDWKTTAIFTGDGCFSPASAAVTVNVPLPVTGDQDGDGWVDADEVQGDDDNDGVPGPLDTDSDNDGTKDGDEPAGNYDCDSYDNVIDPDSDNDGIPDGTDPSPYGIVPKFKLFFSALYHRFNFDSDLPINDANGFNVRAGLNFNSLWGIESEFGYTSTTNKLNVSGKTYNLNLNALYYFNNNPIMPYLTAGAGALLFSGFSASDNTFALNGGIGVMASQPNLTSLALRAEIKGHYGFGGYTTNGNFNLQYSVGLTYRIKTRSTPCNIERRLREARR
jgi:opacity protein-like surface antigen